jgi:hypothetical protein
MTEGAPDLPPMAGPAREIPVEAGDRPLRKNRRTGPWLSKSRRPDILPAYFITEIGPGGLNSLPWQSAEGYLYPVPGKAEEMTKTGGL